MNKSKKWFFGLVLCAYGLEKRKIKPETWGNKSIEGPFELEVWIIKSKTWKNKSVEGLYELEMWIIKSETGEIKLKIGEIKSK